MSKRRLIAILVMLNLLAACSLIENVSQRKESQQLIGKAVFDQDVYLCSKAVDDLPDHSFPFNQMYQNQGRIHCPRGKLVTQIAKGSTVTVKRVMAREVYSILSVQHWYLIGTLEYNGTLMDFFYHYGMGALSDSAPYNPEKPPWTM
ncbi:hypothetical protein ACFOEK_06930 [Litoribrevibacter euphylliae]|uniref:Lipoprotein n=1 Tax=Litoribrevibacter euphylliae TaxID=1834034 RepID=A0ABV7HA34_9GAMM